MWGVDEMRDHTFLNEYYSRYNEEGRLIATNHGRVEYITTMTYIHDYLKPGMKVLEVGAGTGRYCVELAHEGYSVHAIELVQHNLDQLQSKITVDDDLTAQQGDALDLSRYEDETFDLTMLLGPMYHLYNREDKITALQEAVRVTKKGGIIMVAYCMNEPTIIEYCFKANRIKECLEKNVLTEDFHCISKPVDLFELVRVEDIDELNNALGIERLKRIATDGHTNYMRPTIDGMDEETFGIYIKYHLATCERQDLIGASHHVLDILTK